MSRDRKGQRGAILVLTAFLLPFIIAFTGMAVDFGSAYVRRAQLQNAADASVLAGAYHLDDNKADNVVLTYLQDNLDKQFAKYYKQTGEDYPSDADTLNYSTTKSKDELDVTLRSSVNTYFLKVFDINSIPVFATAKAKVSGEDSPTKADDIFDYGLTAGKTPPYQYHYPGDQSKDDSSILIDHQDVKIIGNIATNGRIAFNQTCIDTLTGKIYASYDVFSGIPYPPKYFNNGAVYKKYTPDVWGTINWVDSDDKTYRVESYLTFKDDSDPPKPFTETQVSHGTYRDVSRPDKVEYVHHIDVSRDANSGINELISKYENMKPEDRIANHVYYNGTDSLNPYFWTRSDDNAGYPGWTDEYTRWYRVIIAKGDISVGSQYKNDPTDDEYAIVISLEGSIHFNNNKPFNGIIYAPKGTVTIDGSGPVTGSVVANKIIINHDMTLTAKNFFKGSSGGSSSTGKKTIKLIK
ncbi:pilus assembly protein TadG-related protein [Mitsuokella sp. WILCCON 0060]|uniref:pilus assembly protein TadG-related protein n=1 Tax=Mitsuokella sp. WILCCON 0060 TaxID=3345341 RepID=UPI003F1BF385